MKILEKKLGLGYFMQGLRSRVLLSPRSRFYHNPKKNRKIICLKMFTVILDSVFRLWTCFFWIENRKIKSLAQFRRWVCQGTKIQKYNHNKKYIPYSFFEFFYNFDCISNLHSEIECLLIFLTGASKFVKNSTRLNY